MKINIMTFNIQHGLDYLIRTRDNIRKIDLESISKIIKDSDAKIIGLNEVYNASIKNPDRVKQVEKIASNLNYENYLFAKAITINGTEDYGNAFLSKYKIRNYETFSIYSPTIHKEDRYYEDRVLLKVELEIDNKILTCFITHFGLALEEQELMYNKIIEEIDKVKTPYILMGDFNMCDNYYIIDEFKKIMNISIEENIPTHPSINPQDRIDYIFCSKDIKIISSNVINVVQSDHFPVLATIEF